MPPLPVNLLAILAATAFLIVHDKMTPAGEVLPWWWLPGLAAGALGIALFVITKAAPTEPPKPTDRIDEREAERILTLGAYAAVVFVGAVALLVAMVWPFWALVLLALLAAWLIAWSPRWLRINTLTSEIEIRRDPATVFAFVSNMENEPRYSPMVERVEKLTPGPVGAGTRFSSRARIPALFNVPESIFEGIEEIVDYEPNRRFTSRVASGMHHNLAVMTFEPTPNGTLVTHTFDFLNSYATAVMGNTVMFGPSSNRRLRANRLETWARAKQILESDGQATTRI